MGNASNTKVDQYLQEDAAWREELALLRKIALASGLTEDFKWGAPCYTLGSANVAILGRLKNCCVFSFFKGVLLRDTHHILTAPGSNTQSARTVRFTGTAEIKRLAPVLDAYLQEAIAIEKAGLKPDFPQKDALVLPEELVRKFEADPSLESAFTSLTPGRQRAYVLYFAAAKQSPTRETRIEKCAARIRAGKGLND